MKMVLSFVFLAAAAIPAMADTQIPVVAGCSESDYVQGGMENTITVVAFANYQPRCLRVPVGATVTIQASPLHPLQGMPDVAGLANPFTTGGDPATSDVTLTLSEPGLYGYRCTHHESRGMVGAIQVVE